MSRISNLVQEALKIIALLIKGQRWEIKMASGGKQECLESLNPFFLQSPRNERLAIFLGDNKGVKLWKEIQRFEVFKL